MTEKKRPVSLYVLTLCLVFLSLNALGGGYVLLADTTGGMMGLPQEWLQGTPFPTYFVPGLFLFVVFGLGTLLVLYALWARPNVALLQNLSRPLHEHWAWAAALALGVTLILWIVIQYALLQHFHPLQAIIALLGIAIAAIDLLPGLRRYYAL